VKHEAGATSLTAACRACFLHSEAAFRRHRSEALGCSGCGRCYSRHNIRQDGALLRLVSTDGLPNGVLRTCRRRLAFDRRLLWSIITASVYREKSVGFGGLSLNDNPTKDGRFVARMSNANLRKPSTRLDGTEARRRVLRAVFAGVCGQSTGLSVREVESKAVVHECGRGGLVHGVGVGRRRSPNAEARGRRFGGNARTTQEQYDDDKGSSKVAVHDARIIDCRDGNARYRGCVTTGRLVCPMKSSSIRTTGHGGTLRP